MRLIRFGPPGQERPGVITQDVLLDVSRFTDDFDESFLSANGVRELQAWLADEGANLPRIPPDTRLGPPVPRPSKIVCIGLNFVDHAAESGLDLPKEPVIFFKSSTALSGPFDDVIIPKGGTKLDWEVELAIVIGRRASYVAKDRAGEHIAGYALHNDYSERAFQMDRGGQWVKGKSADTFAPIGPWLATPDEVPDPQRLSMWLSVNGARMQSSTTANMIFDAATLVSYVSEFMTLLPGDVISTGTPAGVAMGMKPEPRFLRPGDVVELGIDGLGTQRQRVVSYTRS
jgi:2,4-diketo-3-deoxy-L-fuconate hydrolase